MNIKEHIEELKQKRHGLSFAFLAERVPLSDDAPYRFNKTAPLSPDDVVILGLAGKGLNRKDYVRGYNGYIKLIDVIKKEPELRGKNIRSVVAVCNFGDYHDPDYAREIHFLEDIENDKYTKIIAGMSEEQRQEFLQPAYIKDIFNEVILPRISAQNGSARLPLDKALYYVRRLNIIGHCHGAYVGFMLERMMQNKMMQLGYSEQERQQIQKQLLILNYAPDCLYYKQKSRCIAIEAAKDDFNKYQSFFKEWLQMKGKRFGFFFSPVQNLFMCTQVDKHGVEGNPPRAIELIPVSDDFLEERWRQIKEARAKDNLEPDVVKEVGEHDFLGFEPFENMSKAAIKVQRFAKNILVSALLNSYEQKPGEKFKPLADTFNLAVRNTKDKLSLNKAMVVRAALLNQCSFENMLPKKKEKLNNFVYFHRKNRIILD